MFKRLSIQKEWRQYQNVDISFHPRLTIITGANGSGKTTILNILNKHFGWNVSLVSTPAKGRIKGVIKYVSGLLSGKSEVGLDYEKADK